jgi:hypothetical protein
VIALFMPVNQPGPERKGAPMILSGILHLLTSGCHRRSRRMTDAALIRASVALI